MKTKLLLFASVLFLFWSCEDGLTTDVNTNLKQEVNIDASVDGLKAAGISFSVADTLSFEDNKDLQNHINNIKEMAFNGTTLTVTEIPVGITADITIKLPQANIEKTFLGVENGDEILIDAALVAKLNAAATTIMEAQKIIIIVNGTVTAATSFKVLFDFDVKVKAGL